MPPSYQRIRPFKLIIRCYVVLSYHVLCNCEIRLFNYFALLCSHNCIAVAMHVTVVSFTQCNKLFQLYSQQYMFSLIGTSLSKPHTSQQSMLVVRASRARLKIRKTPHWVVDILVVQASRVQKFTLLKWKATVNQSFSHQLLSLLLLSLSYLVSSLLAIMHTSAAPQQHMGCRLRRQIETVEEKEARSINPAIKVYR